jgi:hypothetical protein
MVQKRGIFTGNDPIDPETTSELHEPTELSDDNGTFADDYSEESFP